MCGFAGYLNHRTSTEGAMRLLQAMGDAISIRGPDGSGHWISEADGLGFIHRRLAVIELSDAGAQPMVSPSGNYVLVFNGEIYNHLDIRSRIQDEGLAPNWSGMSDTETFLAAIDAWGVGDALHRANGMFAFALWDRTDRSLTLARDRMGEKPLYYGWQGDTLLFGSDLKALRVHPKFRGELDRNALAFLMRYSFIPAPHSIYSGIRKLGPGQILKVANAGSARTHTYWSLREQAVAAKQDGFQGSEPEALDELDRKLSLAVRRQMLSDVPLGALLSGGIDSTSIVALMQSQSARPIRTFTIGFSCEAYDEAAYARAIARHLGTDHTELYVEPADAMSLIPRLAELYSEPFADASQIPTHLVSTLARQTVTVALSGDGGDELFCGYNRHLMAAKTWQKMQYVPQTVRAGLGRLVQMGSPAFYDSLGAVAGLARSLPRLDDKARKAAAVLGSATLEDFYARALAARPDSEGLVLGQTASARLRTSIDQAGRFAAAEQVMLFDGLCYLPDNVLAKLDRAAMGVSLETRVPFLDRDVVEFALRLPLKMKLRNSRTKWILRQLVGRHVPRDLMERPKMGFSVPIREWLRGPLRDWAEALLDETRMRQQGYLDAGRIREIWRNHQSGRSDNAQLLWNALMFQSWVEAGFDKTPADRRQ